MIFFVIYYFVYVVYIILSCIFSSKIFPLLKIFLRKPCLICSDTFVNIVILCWHVTDT